MTLRYTLQEEDFITFQLYTASKSERINKKRRKSWLFTTIFFASLSFMFFIADIELLSTYFGVATGLSLIFYPFYSSWRYKKHYTSYVRENYQSRVEREAMLTIDSEFIHHADETGEGKVKITEVCEFAETEHHAFVKLASGVGFIIPKTAIYNLEKLRTHFSDLGIPLNQELDWKWK